MGAADLSRELLAAAFRRAYEAAGLSQPKLSEATGIDQSLISKYARGEVTPPIHVLPLVDAACGQPRGHILRLAGYVDNDVDTEAAIATDSDLDEDGREVVLHTYRFARDAAASGQVVPDLSDPDEREIAERQLSPDLEREMIIALRQIKAEGVDDVGREAS